MKDSEIIAFIRSGKDQKAFTELYRDLPPVARYIRKNSGSRADAKDIFQDALVVLHRKITTTDFTLTASLSTYLIAICRNLWSAELRRRKKFTSELSNAAEEPTDIEALLANENQFGLAERALRSLGAKCLDLLQRFYITHESLLVIADAIGLSGEGAAKTRKYKCLEEARKRYRELNGPASSTQPQNT